jgi:putative SOS response-associated peptidase YedK
MALSFPARVINDGSNVGFPLSPGSVNIPAMCGRYSNAKDLAELMKLVDAVMRVAFFGPRYNIAPTQMAPVIFMEKQHPAMKLMRWGLIPSWAKDESTGNALINARVETLNTRAAFRQAYQQRRCLVPADSFFEWQERDGKRQPFRIMLKSGEPFCFAGLWERWIKAPSPRQPDTDLEEPLPSQTVESFTIITTQANETMAPLHHRMPVIVEPAHYRWWLENKPGNDLFQAALNSPLEAPLKIYPVSNFVNSPANDDPRCIEPVQIDRDLFEKPWWGD